MITNQDINKLKTVFTTKEELDYNMEGILFLINSYSESLKQEIRDMRTEMRELTKNIENIVGSHDKRISKLEDEGDVYN